MLIQYPRFFVWLCLNEAAPLYNCQAFPCGGRGTCLRSKWWMRSFTAYLRFTFEKGQHLIRHSLCSRHLPPLGKAYNIISRVLTFCSLCGLFPPTLLASNHKNRYQVFLKYPQKPQKSFALCFRLNIEELLFPILQE